MWQSILRLAETAPKRLAAFWFSGCGLIAAAVMFIGPATRSGLISVCLSIVLPAVSAGLAGYWYGASILDTHRTKTYIQAFLRGLVLTLLTFMIFAPLLAFFY